MDIREVKRVKVQRMGNTHRYFIYLPKWVLKGLSLQKRDTLYYMVYPKDDCIILKKIYDKTKQKGNNRSSEPQKVT